MRLIESSELNELNRVVIAIAELGGIRQACSVEAIMRLCASRALAGRPFDHRRILRVCNAGGLAVLEHRKVMLTEAGQEFLSLNAGGTYELTLAQRRFVSDRLVLSGLWEAAARALFTAFEPNYELVTFELDVRETPPPGHLRTTVQVAKRLGILAEAGGILKVTPEYVAAIVRLRSDATGLAEEDLLVSLEAKRKLGAQAEEAVVIFERKRLASLGRHAEEMLVRRISGLNVSAGYDIESFDGNKPLFDHDRHIEVKASQGSNVRFYWTAGERQAARRLGSMYWIYFVGSFSAASRRDISPLMIQDPSARLEHVAGLRIGVATLLVEQVSELKLFELPGQGAVVT